MRLKAHMINIKYSKEIVSKDNELRIDSITFLDEDKYKEGTSLGIDDKECWYTYTHYRAKDNPFIFYQLGFELIDFEENEKNKHYNLYITSKDDKGAIYPLKYDEVRNIYYDSSKGKIKKGKIRFNKGTEDMPGGIDTSGIFFVDVFDNLGIKVYTSPPICVLPSSMSYEDYKSMVDDLLQIKDDLVINRKAKVALKGNWEYRKDSIVDCLDKISNPLKRINRNPAVNLSPKWIKGCFKSIKRVKPRTLIERALLPYNNKYSIQTHTENVDIYENRVIKYALNKLRDKVKDYKGIYANEFIQYEKEIYEVRKIVESKYGTNIEDKLKELSTQVSGTENSIKKLESYYVNNINNILQSQVNNIKDIYLNFDIYKESTINSNSIKLLIGSKTCKLIINRVKNEQGEYPLNLRRGNYRYMLSDNWYDAQFHARVVTIQIETSRLNEIIFFIEKIIESDYNFMENKISILAQAERVSNEFDDPLGGSILSAYTFSDGGVVKEYNINLTKIYSINGQKVPQYDKDYIINKLLLYVNDIGLNSLKNRLINLSENKFFIESILKKFQISKNKKKAFLDQQDNWESISNNIDSLLSLDFFKGVEDIHSTWKPTQIFVNDPNYKLIWKHLRDLDYRIEITSDFDGNNFPVKSTHELYEYWCFFKMIQILVIEQNWKIENYDEIYNIINQYIYLNKVREDFNVKLSHQINKDRKITLTIWYNTKIYYDDTNKRYKQPDYTFIFEFDNTEKLVYIDAKYKNYGEQLRKEWINDVKGVAIDKYIRTFSGTKYFPIASFIVHPDIDKEWTFFGGFLDNNLREELGWEKKPPNHKFGAFAFVPSQVIHFKTFIKMILEYHLGLYDYCWNCGEINYSEDKIKKEIKKTRGGFNKYHYTCNTCGEFWVKTHCDEPEHHNLIKHLYNYHSIRENSAYPWFVECPKKCPAKAIDRGFII